ncbi:MAG TPA: hypothetical protein DET40_24130 [Lentisphaeria bacterium]|nr:MAG: hypothetical protein A2X45_08935 [Lentisphaerae bacterium GWF2_50_93]HCE46648.1 hypothetical protein [Lentisphaeria bacterium]
MNSKSFLNSILFSAAMLACRAYAAEPVDAGAPFGKQLLVQEIDCSKDNSEAMFTEYPKGVSKVETILGTPCRILPNAEGGSKYFAYRVGKGLNLKPGTAYVLSVEFPDDKPRSMFICNWGCETARGIHSGTTVGDAIKALYVNHNPESLKFPLSGKIQTWRELFFLHDRFPEIKRPRGRETRPLLPQDGFWVIIAQLKAENNLESAGAAVSKIRLFEITDTGALAQKINYPPAELPRRYLFFREEMADGVIAQGHKPEEKLPELRGVANPVDWYEYKVKLMKFLGMNTFTKDLLEFGHNQGWDSSKYGGDKWYNQSSTRTLWTDIIQMLAKYPDFYVFPYYEYAGSIGQDKNVAIGNQRRCETLKGGKDYTHIEWCHKTNADIIDPDFIEDAKKLLDVTIVENKDKAKFIGAWFRPRPEANPISFNAKDIEIFNSETKQDKKITREDLQKDKALLDKYYEWWFKKRRDFNLALSEYLRKEVSPEAVLLYTTDSSEPGIGLPGSIVAKGMKNPWEWKTAVVNDAPEKWEKNLDGSREFFKFVKSVPYDKVVAEDMYLQALLEKHGTWGSYEWQHANPWNDPQNYKDKPGIMLSYSFNRLYTVSSKKAFDAFRTPSGLAIIRHYGLNENDMNDGKDPILGYFVADVERTGPYCMIGEARAFANGDPRFIGYLAGNSFNRGFPEYVRTFNAAFLSLPAMPSKIIDNASADPEVIARAFPTEKYGTYVGIVNTGLTDKNAIEVSLPKCSKVTDTVSGETIPVKDGKIKLSMYPGQLRALNLR